MKIRSKLLITLMSTVLGMVGCQKSDIIVGPDGAQVQFSPYIGKSGAVSKGAPMAKFKVGDQFKVYAFNGQSTFFDDVTVSQLEAGKWTYSPLKMWPSDGSTLDFYAYSPVGNTNITANISSTAQTFILKVPAEVSQQVDLIVASRLALSNVDVPLTFKHLTSQVTVKAMKNVAGVADAKKMKVRINSVKIGTTETGATDNGLISDGTYTYSATSAGSWAEGATKNVYIPELTHAASIDLTETATSITDGNQSMFLIPQALATKWMHVAYEYSLDGGFAWTKYTAKIDLGTSVGNFENGKHHVLTLSLSPSNRYTFTASIEDWEDEGAEYLPISPLSTDLIKGKGKADEQTFAVTYTPAANVDKGYTIKSSAADWLKIGIESGLSFADATETYEYAGMGETRAADINSPVQDWYLYLTPNPGTAERRATITVTFKDANVRPAIVTVVQDALSKDENPLKLAESAVRVYSDAFTKYNALDLSWLFSSNEELTRGVTITPPAGVTLTIPNNISSPIDITEGGTNIQGTIELDFTKGIITIANANYQTNISLAYYKGADLSKSGEVRAVAGNYKEAELAPGASPWCKLSFDPSGSNAATSIKSTTPQTVYLVPETNNLGTGREVSVILTDAAGNVTRDYYRQQASGVAELPITADAGTVYFLGGYCPAAMNFITLKSTDAFAAGLQIGVASENGRTFGITAGGGTWSPTASNEERVVKFQFTSATPKDFHIALSASDRASHLLPVKFGQSITSKVFIPGSYNSAAVENGEATVSNDDTNTGSGTLSSVTNTAGLWIHYPENTTGTRMSTILLTNATDWKKTTRVFVYQDGQKINHNANFTDVAHPVKWAGSNVYIDEKGNPAFDDINQTKHSKYRGVLFGWGGLTALQPTEGQTIMVWKPEEYQGTTLTNSPVNFGSTFQLFTPQPTIYHNTPSEGKGDICRYMTEKGLAPVGKNWRLPTSMEISSTAQKGLMSVYPSNFVSDDKSDEVGGVAGPKDLGRGIVEAGVMMGGTFFPASGWRGGYKAKPSADLRYWSSCISERDFGGAASLDVNPKTLISNNHTLPYLYSPNSDRYLPVRCVVDEDKLY